MIGYRKNFDEAKYTSLLIKDCYLKSTIQKYNIEKEFGSELTHLEKYIKTKVKSFIRKNNADFHNNRMLKGFTF